MVWAASSAFPISSTAILSTQAQVEVIITSAGSAASAAEGPGDVPAPHKSQNGPLKASRRPSRVFFVVIDDQKYLLGAILAQLRPERGRNQEAFLNRPRRLELRPERRPHVFEAPDFQDFSNRDHGQKSRRPSSRFPCITSASLKRSPKRRRRPVWAVPIRVTRASQSPNPPRR